MFGSLLGTLQKFRQDENKVRERDQKKKEVEKKIEEKTEKEKEEARNMKKNLFTERTKQQKEIRVLEIQMRRVQEYETWEQGKKREMKAIRTKTAPRIYYMPKEHNEETQKAWDQTVEALEKEIAEGKTRFEEDLLRIENRAKNDENVSLCCCLIVCDNIVALKINTLVIARRRGSRRRKLREHEASLSRRFRAETRSASPSEENFPFPTQTEDQADTGGRTEAGSLGKKAE